MHPPEVRKSVNYRTALRNWNLFVALVHTSSFIALTLISFLRLANTPLTRIVQLWDIGILVPGVGASVGQFPIFATLIPFPLITAGFHVLAAANVGDYYREVLRDGLNRLRWIEYGITNGLMSWSVLFLAGDGANYWVAIACVVSNFIMQLFGYLYERSDTDPRKRSLWYIAIGFLPWFFNWTWTFIYYGNRANSALLSDGFAVIGTFVWSLAFVVPLVYRKYTSNRSILRANYYVELAYVMLSLSAKLWLDWAATVGNLVGN